MTMPKFLPIAMLAAALTMGPALAQTPASMPVPADIDRVLPSGQPAARGRDSIAKAYSGGGGMPTYLRVLDYRQEGDLAYVVGGYGQAGRNKDFGKFVLVLRRVGGRWLIAADIENANMRMGPPQRPAVKPAG
jgi:hypothetical protein